MTITRRTLVKASSIAIGLAGGGLGLGAIAQPSTRPARMVIPWPAGGSTDAAGRLLASNMQGYAPSIVVENKPGAGGRLGIEYVKTAEADGSVFLVSPASGFVIYPHVYKKLSYEPFQDFVPVARICKFPFAVIVGPGVPANVKTLAEFMRWCAANPAQAQYGISAAGSGTHFAGVMLARASGLPLAPIPYKGEAPAIQDVMGGQVASAVVVLGWVLPFVGGGRLRVLATTGAKRSRLLTDVPTVGETYAGFTAEEWFGVFVPRRTPPAAIARLTASVEEALRAPAVAQGYEKLGFEVASETGPAFGALMTADLDRWGPVVKASGFSADE
jgi:tripartite-type tricarboxylate transporter receptor subunit TctC